MGTRADVLDLAILGQLRGAPMHGYELRKQLNATLGAFRRLSYGSLYPALRRLTEAGLISSTADGQLPHALAGKRGRIVYQLTEAGHRRLTETISRAGPNAWDDEAFDVRFTLFSETDAGTRLRILEGRRARMVERLESLRESTSRVRDRMDSYTAELARHGLEQVEREVEWLEKLIDTERGTRGPLDLTFAHKPRATGPPPPGPAVTANDPDPSHTASPDQEAPTDPHPKENP